jgi:hypothetical protein
MDKKRIGKNVSKMLNGIGQQNNRHDYDKHCLLGFSPLYPTEKNILPPFSFPVRPNKMPNWCGLV